MPALVDGEARWLVEPGAPGRAGLDTGAEATIVVRPERILLVPAAAAGCLPAGANAVSGVVAETVYLGAARKIVVDLPDGRTLQVRRETRADQGEPGPGAAVVAGWLPADAVLVAGRLL
jgi:ABC-type Fe3+/spermidine/putrescine transport system ATPase subunit